MCSSRMMWLRGMAKQSVFLPYPRGFCSVPSPPQCPSVCLSTGEADRHRQTETGRRQGRGHVFVTGKKIQKPAGETLLIPVALCIVELGIFSLSLSPWVAPWLFPFMKSSLCLIHNPKTTFSTFFFNLRILLLRGRRGKILKLQLSPPLGMLSLPHLCGICYFFPFHVLNHLFNGQ